jgi:hypothetical protein
MQKVLYAQVGALTEARTATNPPMLDLGELLAEGIDRDHHVPINHNGIEGHVSEVMNRFETPVRVVLSVAVEDHDAYPGPYSWQGWPFSHNQVLKDLPIFKPVGHPQSGVPQCREKGRRHSMPSTNRRELLYGQSSRPEQFVDRASGKEA